MMEDSDLVLKDKIFEAPIVQGLSSDLAYHSDTGRVALEFHYKTNGEATANKIAIYVLEKIKEYAVNVGIAKR
jgi:hypothetical protein